MNKKNKLPLNLQLFADDPEVQETENTEGVKDEETSEEFTAPANQSELDSLIGKAVHTALENQKKKNEADFQEKLKAALDKEKEYSKLSEKDRQAQEFEDERNKFEQERAEFEYSKLLVAVQDDLRTQSLPIEFAEFLAVKGNDEKSLENVKTFAKAFNKAVAEEVNVSLRQNEPGSSANATGGAKNYGAQLAEKRLQNKNIKPFGE